MKAPKISRTYGPIHFEDLDPHRFEDLVREIIYDYKDWQSIEATGRLGKDEGFDIRAYEKKDRILNFENENNEDVIVYHPMEGNLWMIQGKREKAIGPEKIKSILIDIDPHNPPYGYILAASADFSKKSYDTFREILKSRGVMEFYLWGKAELEDMLHLPKNDRILFTFFGISLTSKRKTRTAEVRSSVIIKNKLFKAVGEGQNFNSSVLIRDLNDTYYPRESKYIDFKNYPRWIDFMAFSQHPLGLFLKTKKYFAYVDTQKKEWDYTEYVDLIYHQPINNECIKQTADIEKEELVKNFYKFLPKRFQGQLVIECLLKYSDIELVDDKGDPLYSMPHIYVSFINNQIPFFKEFKILELENSEVSIADDYKRIKVFPEKFVKKLKGKIYRDKKITLNDNSLKLFKDYQLNILCSEDDKYEFLIPGDIIQTESINDGGFIQITYKIKTRLKQYLFETSNIYHLMKAIEAQLGRKASEEDVLFLYEFIPIYNHDLEKMDK